MWGGNRRGWRQVRKGLKDHMRMSGLCLLGCGDPSKVFEQRRAKITVGFKKISNGEEKLPGVEAAIFSLQKGNNHSENSVIFQKLCDFPVFVTF